MGRHRRQDGAATRPVGRTCVRPGPSALRRRSQAVGRQPLGDLGRAASPGRGAERHRPGRGAGSRDHSRGGDRRLRISSVHLTNWRDDVNNAEQRYRTRRAEPRRRHASPRPPDPAARRHGRFRAPPKRRPNKDPTTPSPVVPAERRQASGVAKTARRSSPSHTIEPEPTPAERPEVVDDKRRTGCVCGRLGRELLAGQPRLRTPPVASRFMRRTLVTI